jgi:ribose 5-phosphate isomerase A
MLALQAPNLSSAARVAEPPVRIGVYDGPLELLLFLVRREGVDVREIPVARICDAYLAYLDGADEIGPGLSLIKGGGAALLREKLVWEASSRCVVIADAAKRVKTLGKFLLPIEVVAYGHKTTALRICDALAEFDLGVAPMLRRRDGEPVKTDGGNLIYDAACGRIEEPAALAAALKSVTGVVEHGLFLDLADLALVGGPDGVMEFEP